MSFAVERRENAKRGASGVPPLNTEYYCDCSFEEEDGNFKVVLLLLLPLPLPMLPSLRTRYA